MKILLLCDSLDIGGAETHITGLAEGLKQMGHRVTVAARRGVLSEGLCGFAELDPARADYIARLRELIKSEAPDIVHAHTRRTAFAVWALRSSRAVPSFAFVTTAHARYRTNGALRTLSKWGDECIAVSRDIKEHLVNNYGLKSDEVSVIPNGIDTEKFKLEGGTVPRRIVFAGRLDRDSALGAYCLCRLAPKLPDAEILIAGGGGELERLKRIAPKNVRLLGKCAELSDLMSTAAVVVGVSRVALEGMSCGKNVVLFGNEGALGLLTEKNIKRAEKTNFTCRGCGVKGADFLLWELRRALSLNSENKFNRKYIELHHSQAAVTESTLKIYRNALNPTANITLGGYYGYGNTGDQLLLKSVLMLIADNVPSSRITVLDRKTNSATGQVCRYSPRALISLMKSDIFILGGGSLLQNETSLRSLIYYCSLISLAKKFNNRVVLLANGIGSLRGTLAERLAGAALSKADMITVRDRDSAQLVRRLFRGQITPRLSADLCFLLNIKPVPAKAQAYAVVAQRSADESIGRLLLSHGIIPIFIAMDSERDREAAKRGASFGGSFAECLTDTELFELIGGASLVVSERLHALILALMLGTPFCAVGDSPKLKSFAREVKCPISNVFDEEMLCRTLSFPRKILDSSARKMRKRAAVSASVILNERIFLQKDKKFGKSY